MKLAVALIVLCTALVGCSKNETQMTKDEQENFKGGPMPAGFMEKNGAEPKKGP